MWNLDKLDSILQVITFTALVISSGIGLVNLAMLLPLLYAIPVAIFTVGFLLVSAIKVLKRSNR